MDIGKKVGCNWVDIYLILPKGDSFETKFCSGRPNKTIKRQDKRGFEISFNPKSVCMVGF